VIYSLLRSAAAIALRWYYADVALVGTEKIPGEGPILVVVNHPNALVDVLVAARAVHRRLGFTAKATLFSNRVSAALLRLIGVLPLRRASDEAGVAPADATRNAQSFAAVADALARSAAILIFPEGKSHDDPAMAPARTGAARMVIQAIETRHVTRIQIVPIGLIFQKKDRPRSSVVAIVGDIVDADSVIASSTDAVGALTSSIDSALRSVTLNYTSKADAEKDARVARTIQALMRFRAPSVGSPGGFDERAEIARLLPRLRRALAEQSVSLNQRAMDLEAELLDFDRSLKMRHISLDDFSIDMSVRRGAIFVAREVALLLIAGPIAAWGWINHLIPFRAALVAGGRVRHSAADPAMRTIVAGAAFVMMMYMLQGAAVTLIAGPWWGLAYVVSLPVAADINLRTRDRLRRALRRARAYLSFRARPNVQDDLLARARQLRSEMVSLARETGIGDVG
jgi:1-acyl-sn-glycerol-3-phosphate acyltransferase